MKPTPTSLHVRVADRGVIPLNGRQYLCTVLAVLSDLALVEYTTDNDRTALAFIDAYDPALARPASKRAVDPVVYRRVDQRPCGYRTLLKPWLVAVVRQYGTWIGRSKTGPVPSPLAILRQRFPKAAQELG